MFWQQRKVLGRVRPHPVRRVPGEAVITGQADITEEELDRLATVLAWITAIVFVVLIPFVAVTQINMLLGRAHP